MGYRVGWANAAQTCDYCQVIGKWTWPEFDEMLEEGRELIIMVQLFPQLNKSIVMSEGVDEALDTIASFTR